MTTPNTLVKTLKIQGVALVLAFLGLSVSGISVAESYGANQHTKALAVCRQHAVDNASKATAIRAKLSADQNTLFSAQIKADNDFIVRLISGPISPAEAKSIIANFLSMNTTLENEQKTLTEEKNSNPVPPPPSEQCK